MLKVFALAFAFFLPQAVFAADTPVPFPSVTLGFGSTTNPEQVATSLQIVAILTILSLAPAILMMTTSFVRIVVVLSFLRQAMGTQQAPPNQVLVGLSLFLTFLIMAPTWNRVNNEAIQPYIKKEIEINEAFKRGVVPVREFMLKQTREKDLALFVNIAKIERPKSPEDIPTYVLIPSFIISELNTAFQIGFLIYIPFLILDMVVASVLLAMGMLMLPPVLISLPFKLMLFVLVDGWSLIMSSLVRSYS